ncbi:MAG: CoA protein activase [Thermincola sp.]|jgi:predicted nucleotide-binding protein (sugar kinase/HSP70/actin superfamily)|nr:CoA protein activase [Thermincola sp.]MDT3703707.1 CoA protein activase [Thermincola sp.]
MKVTFAHMGHMHICLKALIESLGMDVIVPPMPSKKTLTLGTQHSPEFACLPLKINMGNFIEAHELGADTILMAGGIGPCRFGYYAQIEREILEDLGYNMKMVVLEPPQKHISELLVKIREVTGGKSWLDVIRAIKFAYQKAMAVDQIERQVHWVRPRELEPGRIETVFKAALKAVDEAKNKKELDQAAAQAASAMEQIPVDRTRKPMRIGIVGEIYVMLEPFVNLDIEKHLGRLGVEVERSIYLSEWINDHLFMGLLKIKGSKEARKHAPPYINHFVGGHGQETIGSTVMFAKQNYDGVIQVQPFTCMPEIVAESILPTVSRDLEIPTFSLIVDEHSGDAGVQTRLEAFVDLLARKKDRKESEDARILRS